MTGVARAGCPGGDDQIMTRSRYPIAYANVKMRAQTFGSDCNFFGTNTKQGKVMDFSTTPGSVDEASYIEPFRIDYR
jgi:hypothetical protein